MALCNSSYRVNALFSPGICDNLPLDGWTFPVDPSCVKAALCLRCIPASVLVQVALP